MATKRNSRQRRPVSGRRPGRPARSFCAPPPWCGRPSASSLPAGGHALRGGDFRRIRPFGLGLVAASGSGLDGFCALLGACFGYLSFQGFAEGLRYVAGCILAFSLAFAFFDVKAYRKSWFMPPGGGGEWTASRALCTYLTGAGRQRA